MVLIDKGPLPNPGGSTGHASNFIFPTDHNKEMAFLTLESQRQYIDHGLNNTCGGIEVARKPERLEEFKRRMTSAKAWGIDARLVTPGRDQGARAVHQRGDPARRLLHAERVVRRLAADRHADARRGRRRPARCRCSPTPRCSTSRPRTAPAAPKVNAVVTDKGRIEAEHVAIACGVWSPRIAAMAGANIPLTPAVHQMADVGPIDILQQSGKEVAYPIVRDMDTFCYERQTAGSMEVGSLRPPPDLHAPRRHPVATRSRRCRPPSCRSPPTTSTSSSKRRSS